ncbi:hypothetical protein CAAN4_A06898 [[Candida] anglica]|uniref:Transcriptional regulatory protein RXT2 N-terminal domain-containing protein n=1 Tax=[Candida] anglica TaxID=148631 RepID=A0ABP0E8N6_9ASCO
MTEEWNNNNLEEEIEGDISDKGSPMVDEKEQHEAEVAEQEEEQVENEVEVVDIEEEEEEEEEDSDDDFDDFNAYDENDDDNSFGSFEEEENEPEYGKEHFQQGPPPDLVTFASSTFGSRETLHEKLDMFLEKMFPADKSGDTEESSNSSNLLSERSNDIYGQLSLLPHLKPPSWVKSKIRRHLLIKLGVPVNLDEILPTNSAVASSESTDLNGHVTSGDSSKQVETHLKPKQSRQRRASSVTEADIDWNGFIIPEFKDLSIDTKNKGESLLLDTTEVLSKIETENLAHSSQQHLLSSVTSIEELNEKLHQYQNNYDQLIQLSSIWQNQLVELKRDYEIYESVVQNFVGHTQRLKREELLANLDKVKIKSQSKKRTWK